MRRALPAEVVVSAKMRLGYEDAGLMIENAQAIESAGASELTVHARTKVQGYAPPAHWQALAEIRQAVTLPLIANGDIWTVDDYRRCTAIAGTEDVMLGRGAIRTPDLARRIRQPQQPELQWPDYRRLLAEFLARGARPDAGALLRRAAQAMGQSSASDPPSGAAFLATDSRRGRTGTPRSTVT